MHPGAMSVSLNVKDIQASAAFYAKLGFQPFAGDITQNWLILKNGDHLIGLFQGMFAKNMLTFNPGWNQNAEAVDTFTDVREWQRHLQQQGLTLLRETEPGSTGPASILLEDPDGNPILIDQHR